MQRTSPGCLFDLRFAAEAVGYNQLLRRQFAQVRAEFVLINLHREIVFVWLESEAACHTATSVVEDLRFCAHLLKELFLRIEADDCLLMAMSVNGDSRFRTGGR